MSFANLMPQTTIAYFMLSDDQLGIRLVFCAMLVPCDPIRSSACAFDRHYPLNPPDVDTSAMCGKVSKLPELSLSLQAWKLTAQPSITSLRLRANHEYAIV